MFSSPRNVRRQRKLALEQLEGRLLLAADLGDAPDTYGTTLAAGGPWHSPGLYMLGKTIDGENNGSPSVQADGDGSDEDGVAFSPFRIGSETHISVFVTSNDLSRSLNLDAWIDFDADGTFSSAQDRIFAARPVSPGRNEFAITVPSGAAIGATYARFRLYEQNWFVGPTGTGGVGEVEDYAIQILPPQASAAEFKQQLIVNGGKGAASLFPADMDNDGDVDLVASDRNQNRIVWHRNDGLGQFTQVVVSTFVASSRVSAADLNADGLTDILATYAGSVTAINQKSDGSFTYQAFPVSTAAVPVDFSKDGRLDLLTAASDLAYFRIIKDFSNAEYLATGSGFATAVDAADIDGDGDVDILGGSANEHSIAWYERQSGSWLRHPISSEVASLSSVSLIDLDADGDLDVVTTADGEIEWFENNGEETFSRRLIATVSGVQETNQADVDGDGDIDLLVAAGVNGAILLINDGAQGFSSSVLPTTSSVGIQTICSGDFDGDGVLEIAVGASNPISSQVGYLAILRRQEFLDFGDAPLPYGTQRDDNGARHYPAGPKLGANRDSEADAPSPGEDGNDEDGVTFGSLRVGDAGATAIVAVQNAPAGARLDAWIDFNRDGLFSGFDERIASNLAVVEGNNVIAFSIPTTAPAGNTSARFRLSTIGYLGSAGGAPDGEVEDYAVSLNKAGDATGVFSAKQGINSNSAGSAIVAVDFDLDSDADLLIAGTNIEWHENDGAGNYTRRVVSNRYYGVVTSLQTADLDGDGDLDVIAESIHHMHWHENLGDNLFKLHPLLESAIGYLAPAIIDLDQDADLDLVLSGPSGIGIRILENQGSGRFLPRVPFAPSASTPAYATTAFAVTDADGDGDLDFYLAPDDGSTRLALYRNEGNGSYTHSVVVSQTGIERFKSFTPVDFDGDGDQDLAVIGRTPAYNEINSIGWYENRGNGSVDYRTIARIGQFQQAVFGDIDADGDFDFLSSQVNSSQLLWHENIGNSRFAVRELMREPSGGNSSLYAGLALVDLDRDADLDIVTASESGLGIAWIEQISSVTADFGDAPQPYPVTVGANGAMHAASGPRLGARRDVETGALNTLDAAGDGADDDGVVFSQFRVAQLDATATVEVQNAPLGAKLDAWVDFDGDGNWSRAEERIAARMPVVEGTNVIVFDVPAWAIAGASFARIRVSTAGGLSYVGAAPDGEVEDYAVTIASPVATTGPYFERHTIGAGGTGLDSSIVTIDLDGDGDNDVVARHSEQELLWYDNDGAGGFARRALTGTQASAGSVLSAGDVDFDGDIDLIAAHSSNFYWFKNDGSQVFTRHYVDTHAGLVSQNGLVDVDGDGHVDFVSGNQWIPNLATTTSSPPSWDFSSTIYDSDVADVDGDGALDVLRASPSSSQTTIGYHRFVGVDFVPSARLTDAPSYVRNLSAADMDRDGDLDVLIGLDYYWQGGIAWLENDGRMNFTRRSISTFPNYGEGRLTAADIDGDGDLDVFNSRASSDHPSKPETAWYENSGDQSFIKHVAPEFAHGSYGVFSLADMDRDGALDVVMHEVSLSGAGAGLAWYSLTDRQIGLSASAAIIDEEGPGSVTFTFTRSGNVAGELIVPFVVGGAAKYDVDYTIVGASAFSQTAGSVTFANGVTTVKVVLQTIDDAASERHEDIFLSLPPLAGYSLKTDFATATIRSAELAGDYDGNGKVDGADFLKWQRSFGHQVLPVGSGADGSPNGKVDGDDLAVWRSNYGGTAIVASSAVRAADEKSLADVAVSLNVNLGVEALSTSDAARRAQPAKGRLTMWLPSLSIMPLMNARPQRRHQLDLIVDEAIAQAVNRTTSPSFGTSTEILIRSAFDSTVIDAVFDGGLRELVEWEFLDDIVDCGRALAPPTI